MWLWQAGTGSSALENIAPRPTKLWPFIYLMLLTLPSLSGWNPSHPTGSKDHSTHSNKKHSFSLYPWPHPHTQPSAVPTLGHGSVLQPKHGILHLLVQKSNFICTVRLTCGHWALLIYLLVKQIYGNGQTMVKMRICEEILLFFN